MKAEVKILLEGYTTADKRAESGEEKTRPTITLIKDGDIVMVVDPGVLDSQQILIDKLEKEGLSLEDVNYVCVTHSHIDHYRNIGMFKNAKTLEYFGIWDGETVEDWHEQFTDNIRILKTPGHDNTSITLFVNTNEGKIAICGDVFWRENSPENDMYATDTERLDKSRDIVMKVADFVIPGHGPMYKSTDAIEKKSFMEKVKNVIAGKKFGLCKKCRKPFTKEEDKCECQPHICFHCCECEDDCNLCNCKHKRRRR